MKAPALNRLWLLTQQALREAMHLRLGWIIALAALFLLAGGSLLEEFNFGAERPRFLTDLAEGTLVVFGTTLAIALPVALFYGPSGGRGLGTLLVCGVHRSEWLLSRLLAAWVGLAWLVLAVLLLLTAVMFRHELPEWTASLGGRFAVAWLRLALVAAITLMFCSLSGSQLLAMLLSLAFTTAGHLAPVVEWGREHGGRAARAGWSVLGVLLPDFSAFADTANRGGLILYAAGYAVFFFLVTCFVFARREI